MKYIFRGLIVFDYDPKTKSVDAPERNPHGNNFNFCSFIPEDYQYMSEFFQKAFLHSTGKLKDEDLEDIEVS